MKQAPTTASMAFLTAMTAAGTLQADVQDNLVIDTATMGNAAYFERLEGIEGIFNGAGQCARMRDLSPHTSGTGYANMRAGRLASILSRDEIGANMVRNMAENDYAVCFGQNPDGREAAHYRETRAIFLEQDAREGCHVNALAQEAHHAMQLTDAAITYPVRDLEPWDNQERLILAMEYDATVMQALVSWRLAHPNYTEDPYIDAMDCTYNEFAENTPYIAEATDMLHEIQATYPAWIENGQAARQIHEVFATNRDFALNYRSFINLYDLGDPFAPCFDMEGGCYTARYTLDDLGIDPDVIGGIHYAQNYRKLPYNEALGARPEPDDRLNRFIPLP